VRERHAGVDAHRPGIYAERVPQAVDSGPSDRPTTASAATPATVLVIEDEPGIVDFVRRGLEAQGFRVRTAADGLEGERMALTDAVDAVVLDLMLPGRGGMEILDSLRRARPALPVIVLSALGELEDRLAGLEAGAVDYLVKPFSLAELVARVRAQLRAAERASSSTLRAGDIELNLLTRRATRAGEMVRLSSTEFELLTFLMRHKGEVLSRTQILSAVWGYQHDPATNIVDVYIGYLRRKLQRGTQPAPIFTVRSVGYRLGSSARA
jgi:DNA-binding response OmpR family regulator